MPLRDRPCRHKVRSLTFVAGQSLHFGDKFVSVGREW